MTGTRATGGPPKTLVADAYEKGLAVAAMLLLAVVAVAVARGYPHWGAVPGVIWAHLATILVALVLTPVMLLRPRGDARHRLLGKVWVAAMVLTAAISFWMRTPAGGFSVIHILSLYALLAAPMVWWTARNHRIAAHRGQVRGMVTGALLIAGFFTLPFGRLLGRWLFA